MMILNKILWIMPILASLSGCAAMSLEQCKTANWLVVGEKDGSDGRERRLDQYHKALDLEQYFLLNML